MQNHLIELFNLITLLKPGQFKTERLFKKPTCNEATPESRRTKNNFGSFCGMS